jgi:hypothetical protein
MEQINIQVPLKKDWYMIDSEWNSSFDCKTQSGFANPQSSNWHKYQKGKSKIDWKNKKKLYSDSRFHSRTLDYNSHRLRYQSELQQLSNNKSLWILIYKSCNQLLDMIDGLRFLIEKFYLVIFGYCYKLSMNFIYWTTAKAS